MHRYPNRVRVRLRRIGAYSVGPDLIYVATSAADARRMWTTCPRTPDVIAVDLSTDEPWLTRGGA